MSKRGIQRFKPAARVRTQLLLAALLWTGVGSGLLAAGLRWLWSAGGGWVYLLLAIGFGAGAAKGRWVLSRTARQAARRIRNRGDGTCLGGFLSWQSWLFVLVMMGAGSLLRHSTLNRAVLGTLYVAVGIALLWGCRIFWRQWKTAD